MVLRGLCVAWSPEASSPFCTFVQEVMVVVGGGGVMLEPMCKSCVFVGNQYRDAPLC